MVYRIACGGTGNPGAAIFSAAGLSCPVMESRYRATQSHSGVGRENATHSCFDCVATCAGHRFVSECVAGAIPATRDLNQQQRVLLVLLALVLALRANAEKLFSPLFAALAGFLGLFGKGGVIWSYKLVISRAGVLVVAQHGLEEV